MSTFLEYFVYILVLFIIFRYAMVLVDEFEFPYMSKFFLILILLGLCLFLFGKNGAFCNSLYFLILGFVIFTVILFAIGQLKGLEINGLNISNSQKICNFSVEESIVDTYRDIDPTEIQAEYAPGWISRVFTAPKDISNC